MGMNVTCEVQRLQEGGTQDTGLKRGSDVQEVVSSLVAVTFLISMYRTEREKKQGRSLLFFFDLYFILFYCNVFHLFICLFIYFIGWGGGGGEGYEERGKKRITLRDGGTDLYKHHSRQMHMNRKINMLH